MSKLRFTLRAAKSLAYAVASAFDREDVLYLVATSCVGSGAWLLNPGAGLICAGLMLAFPVMARICFSRGPQE